MAKEIEVKKIRRRKKKQPDEVKSVKSASSVSELYQNHASDVQKMKAEEAETKELPKAPGGKGMPEQAQRAVHEDMPGMPRQMPRQAYAGALGLPEPEDIPERPSALRMPEPSDRPGPVEVKVSDISDQSAEAQGALEGQPEKNEQGSKESERDLARRSALNNISTFSELHEEPAKKKKKVVVKEKPFLTKPKKSGERQDESQGNIYLELERQGVGRVDHGSAGYEAEFEGEKSAKEEPREAAGFGRPGAMPEYNRQSAVEDYQTYNEESRKKRKLIIHIAILVLEAIILVVVLYYLFHFKSLLENGDFEPGAAESGEYSEDGASEEGGGAYESVDAPATIDFSNDKFALKCTRLQITKDVDGNPAALIFFTFVNKTETPLSMTEVFPPMVVQDGIMCETFAQIENPPDEFYSKDTQIQNGEGIDCAFSVKLQNTTDPVELTIHDNYETFEDVASTVINLQ